MKKNILTFTGILFFTFSLYADKLPSKKGKSKAVKIQKQGTHEGRKVYKVTLSTGKVLEYMYIEEINEAKKTGKWQYNEDLTFKVYNEDKAPLYRKAENISISPSEKYKGRMTYDVTFQDGTIIQSMYPEEIANGIITGIWQYNENFKISKK